jgi:pyruvate/2-oxoglutarate dehydrogenase complex dihydrolipoamide dehydrogenase (E3) component
LNPELGKEAEYAIKLADKPKKVLIAGGGPAGLEAARVAALRGHKVTVMEKRDRLGGNLVTASLPIGKEGMKGFVTWQERQCRQAGVKIVLSREVTPEVIGEIKPDAAIIATGATPLVPPIPGVKKPHVVLAADVLAGKAATGKRVVVVGGGMVGTETAELIAEKGRAGKVTLIEMLPEIAADMDPMNKGFMFLSVISHWSVEVITDMKIEEITDKGVVAVDKGWKRHNFGADTVVLAVGYTPNGGLYETLQGKVKELYIIGDCLRPRKLWNATAEAAHIARRI